MSLAAEFPASKDTMNPASQHTIGCFLSAWHAANSSSPNIPALEATLSGKASNDYAPRHRPVQLLRSAADAILARCVFCVHAGSSAPNIPALPAALSSKASSRIALLELLCTAAAPPTNAQTNTASHQQSQRCAAAAAAAATADIRRFCGVSELHKAALCVVAAVLRCGDSCWAWQDVLTALDAAVGSAGPGILSQPDLLLQIVLLYCQIEQQLAGDLAQQAVQLDAVLLVDIPQQQQQGLGAAGGSSSNGRAVALAAAAAQLPMPSNILHAVEKLGRSLPNGLHPGHTAAQWIVAHSGQLQGATRVLLQRWLAALLPACANSSTESAAAAAAGSGSSGAVGTGQMQQGTPAVDAPGVQQQQQQQEEGCAALVGLLLKFPGALQVAVQLARSCLEAKQQQQQLQLASWLCILTATLHSVGSSTSGSSSSSSGCDPNEWEYLSYVSLQGAGSNANAGSISSSSVGLQQLLLGPAGVLELCKRSLLAAAGSAGSSWGSSLVVLACNSCLLAAVNAAAAAAAAGDEGSGSVDGSYAVRQQLEQQLLQYGIQQVRAPYVSLFRFACYDVPIHCMPQQQLGQ
jgi:hypothetical protein